MNKSVKKKNAMIFFLLFICILIPLNFIKIDVIGDLADEYKNDKMSNNRIQRLKNSNLWNLTGSPILIDDWRPKYTWEKISSENEWCFGNGTLDDPYIIENVIIDGKNSGSCITIRNSDAYFIIRNCLLNNAGWSIFNYGSGIKLINTHNGKLLNNNCSYNNGYGILQIRCFNNNISGNIVNYNSRHGIYSWRSDDNDILENEINYNEINGVHFWFSDRNNISGNTINYNQNGINLIMSNNNFITFNYLVDNNVSIYQFWSFGNIIKNNKYEYEPPAPETINETEKNDDEDDGDTEEIEAREIPYISLIIVGTSLGLVSGGIIGYLIQKKRIEKKSLLLFSKPLKEKPKADSSLSLEEEVESGPEFEFVPKGAIMKFVDIKKLAEEQKDLKKNNLSENKKK